MKQSLPMRYHLPRILSLSVVLLAGALLPFPFSEVRAADCIGVSGLGCVCSESRTCPSGYERSQLIEIRSSGVKPFENIECSEPDFYVCLRLGADLCGQTARFMTSTNPSSCKTRCDNTDNELTQVDGLLCEAGKRCCLENPSVGSAGSCLNLAGVSGTCKATVSIQEIDVSQLPYWTSMLTMPFCPDGTSCTVTLSTELCKAAAKHSMDFDEEMGITVSEGPEKWQCVSSKSNCDKQGDVSTELSSVVLFGNANSGSPCPAGQYCCVPKEPEAAKKTSVGTAKTLPDPLGGANIHSIIGNIIRTFAGIAGSIALIMFVYGGIMMITSGGAQDKVKSARTILMNAAIGIVLIFAAYTFVAAIIDAILAE